ncbi:MAG: hypothetical protein KME11_16565 [Timaviella obliquedivisa GSE-PSE-MK23-08B]|jgi:hypothetical protein|nr:hypothetical protein [Timaviella obliquedivisa GSE-PSE-MK23-08B]
MKYLFWCSGASALVLGFIFLRSSQVTQSSANPVDQDNDSLQNSQNNRSLPPPQNLQTTEQSILERAKTSANSDRLKQAINLADTLPTTSEYYATAQQLREVWARELLQRAINKYVQADLPTALKMLAAIPANTSSAGQSIQLATLWQQEKSITQVASQAKTSINLLKVLSSRYPKGIALPPAAIQPSAIQPITAASKPPQRVVLAEPSAAALQEDQRVLEMLSTIPAHWNQHQRNQRQQDQRQQTKPVIEKAIADTEFSAPINPVVPAPPSPEASPSPYFSTIPNSVSNLSQTLRSDSPSSIPTPSTSD